MTAGPTVVHVPSLQVASLLAARPGIRAAGAVDVLSLSDPAFGPELPRLPGTARETDALVEVFGSAQVGVLQGAVATEEALRDRISSARILHLATHGLSGDGTRFGLAALALAPGPAAASPENDGLLHEFEIRDLQLDCELAVLSACRSGTGRVLAGEGAHALSSSFLGAGARRVVASLWEVDDAATAALMADFLRRLARDESTEACAQALREAQLALRRDPRWTASRYWAAFVLVGEP